MQDYLIVKGHINPIKTKNAPKIYKLNEWTKLDRIVRATIRMHLSQSMYYTVQSDLSLEIYFFRRINPLCKFQDDTIIFIVSRNIASNVVVTHTLLNTSLNVKFL